MSEEVCGNKKCLWRGDKTEYGKKLCRDCPNNRQNNWKYAGAYEALRSRVFEVLRSAGFDIQEGTGYICIADTEEKIYVDAHRAHGGGMYSAKYTGTRISFHGYGSTSFKKFLIPKYQEDKWTFNEDRLAIITNEALQHAKEVYDSWQREVIERRRIKDNIVNQFYQYLDLEEKDIIRITGKRIYFNFGWGTIALHRGDDEVFNIKDIVFLGGSKALSFIQMQDLIGAIARVME